MNLKEILENSILTEAVRINNGKEAYELINTNKIGVKLDPSYKLVDKSIIPYLDNAVNSVGVSNAPFAIQLLANKVPADKLKEVVNSDFFKNIITCKNKPWAKQIPNYKEIIDFSSKEKFDQSKWNKVGEALKDESQNHGKKSKGGGNNKEAKTLYDDGVWSLQIPTSYEGAKAISFYGKKGEEQLPTHWCTRADKRYYDMYAKNSPLYIIKDGKNGKAYQVAFDKINVYFLDQDDTEGDKITKGDLSSIPDNLLKLIKWNGRTLEDYKKEYNRTETKKGELSNPTTDFKDAEWEAPKDEGDGIVSQVMKNLHNKEEESDLVTFMIKGKPFKFNKRNNYAKKYYYKDKPNLVVISVLSKNGQIKDDIFWPFKTENGKLVQVKHDDFIKLVGDRGNLLFKAAEEKSKADNKRRERSKIKDMSKKDDEFNNRMSNLLGRHIKAQFIEDGLIENHNGISVQSNARIKNIGNGKELFGNFIPLRILIELYTNKTYYDKVGDLMIGIDNMKSSVLDTKGIEFDNNLKQLVEKSIDKALRKYAKEAIKDKYGRNRRIDFREKVKNIVTYDNNSSKKLQFESYFGY